MKVFFFLVFVSIMVSCSSGGDEQQQADSKTETVDQPARAVVEEYKQFIAGLDSTQIESSGEAMKKFRELFKGSSKETCDSGFVLFEHLYESLEQAVSSQVESDTVIQQVYWDHVEKTSEISLEIPMLKKYERKLIRNGYRFEIWEGNLMAGRNRAFLKTHFYPMLSPVMNSFLKLCHADDDDPFQHDAGIVIPEKEYAERLIRWENFIKQHPDFIRINRAKEMYRMYFTYFLTGMDNTPSYERQWHEGDSITMGDIDPYFEKAYTYLKKNHPNSTTYAKVKPYWKAILQKDQANMKRLEEQYRKEGVMIDFTKPFAFFY